MMKKLLLILLCLPMIGFGQKTKEHREVKEKGIQYIEQGKYKISKVSGYFTMGTSWVPKERWIAINEIEKFIKSVNADNYKIVKEHIRPTHSGLGNYGRFPTTYGRLDITFVLLDGETIRLYDSNNPNGSENAKKLPNLDGEWVGNGSGIIISKSGHIITNHHVIDDADDIEVEFILDNEVQKFNAEIIQVDKVNDLAIIKILDVNFDGVKELLYNFKTRSSDVGTKVYAFGYPMALSIMGKEIKVTDGMISSKTGFDGNVTTYQITAPIQAGNSGGPLFDDKGNFIGINSSGIRKDIADNVGYSIKTSYALNLIDILPRVIELPSNKKLASLPLTEQIKQISKYVVLIKVK